MLSETSKNRKSLKMIDTGEKYYGRKGFYAMCGGGRTEPGGAIHIRLPYRKPTIIFFSGLLFELKKKKNLYVNSNQGLTYLGQPHEPMN